MTAPPSPSSVETPSSVELVETQPLLRIVKGDPSPEEIAALVTVVSSMAAGAAQAASRQQRPRPEWSARHQALRGAHRHGPGAWRASVR